MANKHITTRPEVDSLLVHQLDKMIRRQERILQDLRQFRSDLSVTQADRGVLGSRKLTQYVLERLREQRQDHDRLQQKVGLAINGVSRHSTVPRGLTIRELLVAAETIGYSIPTARALSKRLVERRIRVKDVDWDDEAKVWFWCGD